MHAVLRSSVDPAHADFEIPVEAPAVEEQAAQYESAAEVPEVQEPVVAAPPVAEQPAVYEAAPEPPAAVEQPAAKIPEPASKAEEPEFELDQDYELVLDPEPLVPAHDQKTPEVPIAPLDPEPEPVTQNAAPANGFASDQFLTDLANEIDQLGIGVLSPGFSGSTPAGICSVGPLSRP